VAGVPAAPKSFIDRHLRQSKKDAVPPCIPHGIAIIERMKVICYCCGRLAYLGGQFVCVLCEEGK